MDWSQNAAKLYRVLLYSYPAEFRHEYGSEMEQLFTDRLHSEPHLRLWFETVADIAVAAPREHWHILVSDLRYGTRMLVAAPAFTAIALLVIALGIAATTSVFSLVNAVLLRSLPYGHPEQLVYLWSPNTRWTGGNIPQELAPNTPDFYDWQSLSRSFSSMTTFKSTSISVVQDGIANRIGAAFVTGTFFKTLEAFPKVGRSIGAADDQPGHEHVAVISEAFWRAHLNTDAHVLGKQIQLNRDKYTIVGIMQKEFGYPFAGDIPYSHSGFERTDIWLPLAYSSHDRTNRLEATSADAAIGRLRKGVSAASAQAELKAIESRLDKLYPEIWRGWTAFVNPVIATILGPVEKMLWLLLGAVAIVLLIAISNVANLLLARVAGRAHEMGIRTALGAERSRIVRQLLTESLLLSCTGGALGIALAYAAVQLLVKLNPGDIPRFDSAAVDTRVLLIALALSIGTGLLSGLAPTLSASRADINQLMKQGGSRGAIATSNRWRHSLILAEVALSVVLLAGAGLLVRSYLSLSAVNPGFSPSTLTFRLNLDHRYATPEQQIAFYKKFLEKLQRLPGVRAVGGSNETPLNHGESISTINVRGLGKSKELVEYRSLSAGYLGALGVPILRGRNLNTHDPAAKPPVVLVNERLVRMYFHGREPIGQQVNTATGDTPQWSTVVGVVGDVRNEKLEQPGQPQIFEFDENLNNYAIASSIPASQMTNQVRQVLRSLDPALSLEDVHTMRERIDESNARRRFQTTLLSSFAALAVALALVGLYGLMSYAVKQRTAEIGVRMAVGSSRTQVLTLILSQGLRLVSTGLVLGLAAAFALTRLVSNWLFGVSATDPVTFAAVPLFILLVATCACLIPAWQATRIDPVQALRQE